MSSGYNPSFITSITAPGGIDIQNNSLFIGCTTCRTVSKYDTVTGVMSTLISDVSASVVVCYNNTVYTSEYFSGSIRAFNATTGAQVGNNPFISRASDNGTGFAVYRNIVFACHWGGYKISLHNASTASDISTTYINTNSGTNGGVTTINSIGYDRPADLTIDPENNYLYVVIKSGDNGRVFVYDVSAAFTGSYTTPPLVSSITNAIPVLAGAFGIVCRGNVLYISLGDRVVTYNSKTGAEITNATTPFVSVNDISSCNYLTTNGSVGSYLYTASTSSGSPRVGRFALTDLSNNKFIDLNNTYTAIVNTQTHNIGVAVANNIVYAVRNNFGIGAYNATTGAVIHDTFIPQTADASFSQVQYYNDVLYVSRFGGTSPAGVTSTYNASTGAVINSSFITRNLNNIGSMAWHNNLLFAVSIAAKVVIHNITTGAVIVDNYIPATGLGTTLTYLTGIAINPDTNYLYLLSEGNQNTTGKVNVYDISNVSTPGVTPTSGITARLISTPITNLYRPYSIVYRGNVLYISQPDSVVTYNATTFAAINTSPGFVPVNDISGFFTYAAVDNSLYSNAYLYASSFYTNKIGRYAVPNLPIICFKEDTRILTDNGYKNIQDLRKGVLVKTSSNGYKAIHMIGKKVIRHIASEERIKDQLYRCSKNQFPELWDDLFITGRHSILVDNFASEVERNRTEEVNKGIFVTEGKYRVPACVHGKTSVYETPGEYTVYHFALENDDIQENFGIYANGLLVESCSILVMNVLCDLKSYNLITERLIEDKETFSYMTGKIQLLNDEVAGIE